jgi:hypothetical protein
MSARRGVDLGAVTSGREIFSKKVALQRVLNRGESAFLEFIMQGLPEEVAFDRLQRAIALSKQAFETIFGPEFDEEVFRDFIPTSYDITVANPHDDERAIKIMSDYLKIASESAESIWPDGAPKKPFPFKQQNATAPTLASITLKLARCADIYDLRVGRNLFVRAMSTMIIETAVDLAQRMMPEAGKQEVVSLTQSLIRRVGALAIESWRETAQDLIAKLRVLPESERTEAALAYNPLLRIRMRVTRSLDDVPEFVISMNKMIDDTVDAALKKAAENTRGAAEPMALTPGA